VCIHLIFFFFFFPFSFKNRSGRRGRPLKNKQSESSSSSHGGSGKLVSVEQSAKHRQLKKERKESILPNFATGNLGATLGGGGGGGPKVD